MATSFAHKSGEKPQTDSVTGTKKKHLVRQGAVLSGVRSRIHPTLTVVVKGKSRTFTSQSQEGESLLERVTRLIPEGKFKGLSELLEPHEIPQARKGKKA